MITTHVDILKVVSNSQNNKKSYDNYMTYYRYSRQRDLFPSSLSKVSER